MIKLITDRYLKLTDIWSAVPVISCPKYLNTEEKLSQHSNVTIYILFLIERQCFLRKKKKLEFQM